MEGAQDPPSTVVTLSDPSVQHLLSIAEIPELFDQLCDEELIVKDLDASGSIVWLVPPVSLYKHPKSLYMVDPTLAWDLQSFVKKALRAMKSDPDPLVTKSTLLTWAAVSSIFFPSFFFLSFSLLLFGRSTHSTLYLSCLFLLHRR